MLRSSSVVEVLALIGLLSLSLPVGAEETPAGAAEPPSLWTRTRGEDWPGFLGPARDGKSAETGIRSDWSDGLPILWYVEVGEGYSAPSVAAGRLFVFDRVGGAIGGRARLRSLNAETGTELWRSEYPTDYQDYYQYSNGPRASPVVDGDRVYTFGVEGRLRCHRVIDGELLWEVDTAARYGVVQNFFGAGSTPAVEGDLLIAQVGGSPPNSPPIHSGAVRPNGTAVVAFDKRTGGVRYSVGAQLASYAAVKLATVGERRWGLVFARGGLLAFEPTTGEIDFFYPWRAPILESVNAATPVVVGDQVLITETYGVGASLLAIRPGGYEVIWKDPPRRGQSLAAHWATPIYHDGVVYGSSGRNSGDAELRAVRFETGEVLWSEPRLKRSTLLSVDGHLVVLSEDGVLRLLRQNPEKYELVAELTVEEAGKSLLNPPAWNAPVLSHGILYVRGKDRLVALELIAD
jgi:outer membrane protein assembly factor BamB